MNTSYNETDIFLTHTWAKDKEGRDNHKRVALINDLLCRKGYRTWFDGQRMEGPLQQKMKDGIDSTKCVIVFVTDKYMLKINSEDPDDNCFFEYSRAMKMRTKKYVVCVAMEPSMKLPSKWEGYLKETMGDCLCVRMIDDFDDETYLTTQVDELVAQLKLKGVLPSQVRKQCTKCNVIGEGKYLYPCSGDRNFCTTCGDGLQEIRKPKNYCSKCNIHELGIFCGNCGDGLQERGERQQESVPVEKLYEQMLKQEVEEAASNYSTVDTSIHERIKSEMEEVINERTRLQAAGATFLHEDESYLKQRKLAENNMVTVNKEWSQIKEASDNILRIKATHQSCTVEFQTNIKNLQEQLKEAVSNYSKIEVTYENGLKEFQTEVTKMKEIGIPTGIRLLPPNHDHPRTCRCHICTFEDELVKKLAQKGFGYIEQLIKEDDIETLSLAIDINADIISMQSDSRRTTFLCAVGDGTVEMIKMLVAKGAQVGAVDSNNRSALYDAVANQRYDIVECLCSYNIELVVNVKETTDGWTPLHLAASLGNRQLLKLLLAHGGDPKVSDNYMRTPVYIAQEFKHAECKEELEKCSNYPDVECELYRLDKRGFTYIEELVSMKDEKILLTIINVKPDVVNMRNNVNGWTPLHYAASQGDLHSVQLLLANNADVALRDLRGYTPLWVALEGKKTDCINVLQKHCEDPDLECKKYALCTQLDERGFSYVVELVRENDIATLSILIDVRNDVISMRGGYNVTPFLECASNGTVAMLQMLASKGASAGDVGEYNNTPLHRAVIDNKEETVHWLCQHHDELLHVKNVSGDTPLHRAAYWGHSQLLPTLLQHGADVTLLNNDGRTPLAVARKEKETSCAKVLVKWLKENKLPVK